MSDADLALSILRKFAAGVHTMQSNWFDPDSGCIDGHISPTAEERDLLQRLDDEERAKAEAEYAASRNAKAAPHAEA